MATDGVALTLSGYGFLADVGAGPGGSKGRTNHLSLPGQVLPGER